MFTFNRNKVSQFDIGLVLNHARVGVTGRVYDQAEYDDEKRKALALWDRLLRTYVAGKAAETAGRKVVEFTA